MFGNNGYDSVDSAGRYSCKSQQQHIFICSDSTKHVVLYAIMGDACACIPYP